MATRSGFMLYVKDRGLAAFLAATVTLAVVNYMLGRWLMGLPSLDPREARTPLTVLAPIMVMVFASMTVAGGSPTHEATSPRLTASFRCLHATAICALASVVLGISLAPDIYNFGSLTISRNTLGAMGLMLVCYRVQPVACWAVPALYMLVTYMASAGGMTTSSSVWTWPTLTGEVSALSWLVALGLMAMGLGLYALPRRAAP